MAKTLGSILSLAGTAALVATGVGAIGGLAFFGSISSISFGTVGLGSLLTASSILKAAGAVIGGLGGNGGQRPEPTRTAIKTEIPPRVSGYGRLKLYGAYILYETVNGTAVDCWAFHDGQIDGIERYYLGDKQVTRKANGFVEKGDAGIYGTDIIQIGANLGLATETAHAALIAAAPAIWSTDHRGDGVVTGYMISKPVKAKDYQEVYSDGGPDRTPLGLAIRAQLVFDWRDSAQDVGDPRTWKWSENAWLHIAHYKLVREFVGPMRPPSHPQYWSDIRSAYEARWSKMAAPTLAYWTACANDADSPSPLRGGTTVLIGANAGASTIQVTNATGLSVGQQITIYAAPKYIVHETVTISQITGTLIDITGKFQNSYGTGSLVRTAAGTEPRYRSCVSHKHTDPHKQVLSALLNSCDGWIAQRADGAYVPRPGRYYAPTVTVGPDVIVQYSVEEGIEDENALNILKVTYISDQHDFNQVDTDDWTDEDDIEARGAVRSDSLENQVPSHAQAGRLAKRKMAKVMAPKRGTFLLTSQAEAVLTERYVRFRPIEGVGTDNPFVAYDGPVEITSLSINLQNGQISGGWIAADENIDAWNPATEEGDPAPVGERVAVEPIDQPAIISASAVFSPVGQNPGTEDPAGEPVDGTTSTGARVLIAASGPDRTDLTWYARWRVGTSGSWNEREYADADPGPGVSFTTEFVPLSANINVEVSYTVGDGRASPWSDPAVVDTRQT